MTESRVQERMVEVRVIGMPIDQYRRTSEHHDELIREFTLMSADEADSTSVPRRLVALMAELQARFSGLGSGPQTILDEAIRSGASAVDLVYHVPPEVGPASADFDRLLDEADEFCRAGDLLTLASPSEIRELRSWFLSEFVRQTRGEPPIPWQERE